MTVAWEVVGSWPVRALFAGGAVLLVGRLLVALARQPARRAWVGTTAVVVALIAIPLSLVPGWLTLSVPGGAAAARPASRPQGPVAGSDTDPSDSGLEVTAVPGREPAPAIAIAPTEMPAAPDLNSRRPDRGTPDMATAPPARASGAEPDWSALVGYGYGLLAVGFLARLAVGHLALARLWRKAHPAPAWVEVLFRRLAGPVRPRAELRVSARPVGPVCFGVLRPRVLVPTGLLAAGDGPAVRAILAHELAHLGRRDPVTGWLLGLARAAYFVCPWLPGLRREVRVAQECLADADAARHAAGPADYAELLIRMARSRPAPLGAAGARGPNSELYRRVTMLLRSPDRVEGRCPRRWALTVGGGLTALAVLAAGLSVRPRAAAAAEPEKAAPARKEAPKGDPLKDALDKLQKDLKDDPAALKLLDELKKEAQKPADPGAGPKVPPSGFNPRPLLPRVAPGVDVLDGDKEIELAQELLRQQLEMLQKIQGAVGARGGAFVLGPDGFRPLVPGGNRGGVRLGVRVERPNEVLASQLDLPPGQGLVCVDVPADSVAGKAGIKPHDVLLEVGGKAVSSNFAEFQKVLADVKPDAPVDIVVLRKGKKETIKGVKLPEAKPVADFPGIPDFPAIPAFPNEALLPLVPGRPTTDAAPPGDKPGVPVGPGETARVEQVNDAFTVFYAKNGVKVTIAGTKDGGVPRAESIEVDDNGKTTKAESIDKLPKAYQEMAKNALKAVK